LVIYDGIKSVDVELNIVFLICSLLNVCSFLFWVNYSLPSCIFVVLSGDGSVRLGFLDVEGILFGLFGHECTRWPSLPHIVHRGVEGSYWIFCRWVPIRISLGRVLDMGARIQSLAYRPLVVFIVTVSIFSIWLPICWRMLRS